MTTASVERLAIWAMGTRFELVLAADDAGVGGGGGGEARELRAIGEAALAEVADLDARWSLFRPDSVVSLINREAGARGVRVDHDTFEVLTIAERVRTESGGMFDVTVGGAMERWGFRSTDPSDALYSQGSTSIHVAQSQDSASSAPEGPRDVATGEARSRQRPSATRGCELLRENPPRRGGGKPGTATPVAHEPPPPLPGRDFATPAFHGFRLPAATSTRGYIPSPLRGEPFMFLDSSDRAVCFIRPGVAIDLGGIAKGYAIDAALRVLREHGVTRALIHGGTSGVGAIGAPPGEDGWRIAIGSLDPEHGATRAERPVVSLRDSCLAVSSPAGREVERDGRRLGHIIDPRTGTPTSCARTACVIGPSAALCDAWAKPALFERRRPPGLPIGYAAIVDSNDDPDVGGSPGCSVTDPLRSRPEVRPMEVR